MRAKRRRQQTQFGRRKFFKYAASAAAVGALTPTALVAQRGRGRGGGGGGQQAPLPALGNGEPPAIQFQAYPGGTGVYMEKIARERGRAAFDRSTFVVEPWSGPVPTSDEEIAFLPVHRLSALVGERRLSSLALTEIYLRRLKQFDPTLLFTVTIMEDHAREAARQADAEIRAGRYRGPLHGIPWGVKDLFSTRGAPTTWGAEDFKDRIIDEDAEVVVRLRNAGAVLLAKLATGQFASGDNWFRGQTRNPWNPEQGSSGSSAGPASATAAGCVGFGIGTETQGSIISPARRCGLSALRPTFGRISRYGGMVLAWSMDKVGPLCRTVEDCALVFNTIHGADEKDPATLTAPFQWERDVDLSTLKIGYADDAPEAFVETLRALGAQPVPMPDRPSMNVSSLGVESAAAFDFYVSARAEAEPAAPPEPVEPAGGRGGRGRGRGGRFTRGRTTTALDYLQSQRHRQLLIREMATVMGDFDMYVSGSGDIRLTNQTGHPSVVVPYMFGGDDHEQPQCLMLIGNLFADDKILAVAHAYQQATDWHERHPALPA